MLRRGNGAGGMGMSDSEADRAAAGVAFLFAPGKRPDGAAWRGALDACQARVQIVREAQGDGCAELVLNGLAFDVDGLAPGAAGPAPAALEGYGVVGKVMADGREAVRLYPGHHLSGGLGMLPVVRALAALAAEIAVKLPMEAVVWCPSKTAVEPQVFAHSTLAWLGGGAFPTHVLTALTVLGDGSVVSRGLAHFIGQEATLRPRPGETGEQALRLAAQVIDHLVLHGPVREITEMAVAGEALCFEPAQRGGQVWVWRKAD